MWVNSPLKDTKNQEDKMSNNTPQLPRQTYNNQEAADREARLAEIFAIKTGHNQLKVGVDDPNKMKPRIDRAFYRDGVLKGFFEAKGCPRMPFGSGAGWTTGQRKTKKLRELFDTVRVPVLYLVEFSCGTIAYVNVTRDVEMVPGFGRFDRGDQADAEGGTRYKWSDFTKIREPNNG
jgi:hypothetical protein